MAFCSMVIIEVPQLFTLICTLPSLSRTGLPPLPACSKHCGNHNGGTFGGITFRRRGFATRSIIFGICGGGLIGHGRPRAVGSFPARRRLASDVVDGCVK